MAVSGIGHNGGPALEGRGWRRTCWTRARAELLPHMPLNVVRRRVARAAELGLDYRTYASVRAATGRDIVGFLFSQNGLGLVRPRDRLSDPAARRLAVVQALRLGLDRGALDDDLPLDALHPGPGPHDPFARQRALLDAARAAHRLPADGVVLVGAAPWERGWSAAGRLAGYVDGPRYFAEG
ncbi:hypothetical protein DXV76_12645 [Rhodobacteraceae bacterium CCMM004]|nr:hypothetical protein DXV76_12645 [Rhodobacteraceae bacterium CCMM004]